MTTSIDKLISGMNTKRVPSPQTFNGAVSRIAPKATNGGTTMPKSVHERMAHARAAKGKMPKAVKQKPLNAGTFSKKAKGSGPVSVPSPIAPMTDATNTTAGNTANGLHIHIHTNSGGGY